MSQFNRGGQPPAVFREPLQSKILYLSDDGEQTGTTNMNVNGAITPQYFYLTPPANRHWYVYRMTMQMRDTSVNAVDFGGITNGLANGFELSVRRGSATATDYLWGGPGSDYAEINDNVGWGELATVDVERKDWGAGDDFVIVRWTIPSSFGGPWHLESGEYLVGKVQDDLTSIVDFQVMWHIFEDVIPTRSNS